MVSRRLTVPALFRMQTPALDSSCRAVPAAARGGRGEPEVGAAGWVTGQHLTDAASLGQKLRRVPVVCSCNKQLFFFYLNFLFFPPYEPSHPLHCYFFRAVNTTTPGCYINHISLASSFECPLVVGCCKAVSSARQTHLTVLS